MSVFVEHFVHDNFRWTFCAWPYFCRTFYIWQFVWNLLHITTFYSRLHTAVFAEHSAHHKFCSRLCTLQFSLNILRMPIFVEHFAHGNFCQTFYTHDNCLRMFYAWQFSSYKTWQFSPNILRVTIFVVHEMTIFVVHDMTNFAERFGLNNILFIHRNHKLNK